MVPTHAIRNDVRTLCGQPRQACTVASMLEFAALDGAAQCTECARILEALVDLFARRPAGQS
jgi:hypothetical protein